MYIKYHARPAAGRIINRPKKEKPRGTASSDGVYKSNRVSESSPMIPRGNLSASVEVRLEFPSIKSVVGQSPGLLITEYYSAAIEAILSPSRIFITRTPWVARERSEIEETEVRIT